MQKLLSKLRQGINFYSLIKDGDKIAVGLSGGKDSMLLLTLLASYQKFSPEKFELIAITLNPGSGCDFTPLHKYCADLGVEYHEIPTDIFEIVFNIRQEKNPCSLCAKLRRGALNDHAKRLGCNKIALGHHMDDAIETLLLSMFYEGRINCFQPKTYLEEAGVTLIRPMVYIEERDARGFAKRHNLPIIENPCPANGHTKREEVKTLIDSLKKDIPSIKKNLFGSLTNTDQLSIWDRDKLNQID